MHVYIRIFQAQEETKYDLEVLMKKPNELGKQQQQSEKLQKAISRARDIAISKMYEAGAPGLVVGVSVDGKSVWKHGCFKSLGDI